MIAAKHMDPLVGVDIHITLIPTPAGPVPTPLPNPYVGMVFDVMDYEDGNRVVTIFPVRSGP